MQEQLKQKYLVSLREKAKLIEALFWQYLDGDRKALETLRLHAHSLKGSGATFGFPDISDAGRELEQAGDEDLKVKLETLLRIIKEVAKAGANGNAANEEGPVQQTAAALVNKALIIVRNPENARIIGHTISRIDGIEGCVLAGTGADARREYTKTRFSLVVLDLVLPDRDGREILREIKATREYACPVLVISGVPSDKIYLECMNIGADEYLSKPFDTDKLSYEAQQIVLRHRTQTASIAQAGITPAAAVKPEKVSSSQLKDFNILVAEDDEMQALFIEQKLQAEGAQVTLVENGREALAALEAKTYSAVILDGRMPEMDGFQALEAIRGTPRLKGLPVIMLTAMGSEADVVRGYQLGADDYILKPFSEIQLVSRLKKLLTEAA